MPSSSQPVWDHWAWRMSKYEPGHWEKENGTGRHTGLELFHRQACAWVGVAGGIENDTRTHTK